MKNTFLALCSIAVLLYACKDEDVGLVSTQATQDHLLAEQTFNDVGIIVKEAFFANGINKSYPKYTIMDINSSNADTLVINYGPDNRPYLSSILKRGKIIVTYTGKYRDSLAVITSTFDNYYINNNLIQGERVVTNQGRDSVGNMGFTIEVNNVSIVTSNGIINWSSNRTKKWVNGQNTSNTSDDRYKITGSANGIGVNNNSFSTEITDALNMDLDCLPSCVIKSGTAKISPNGYADRIINYGDSLCDCNFDITINGTNYPIELIN